MKIVKRNSAAAAVLLALLLFAGAASATTITASDMGSLRNQHGSPSGFFDWLIVNDFPGIPNVDTGAAEFNISGLSGPVSSATLNITLQRNNGSSTLLPYEVFGYAGDGDVSFSNQADFSAGTLAGSFSVTGEAVGTVFGIDVTSSLNSLLALGETYAGFNIRSSAPEFDFNRFTWFNGVGDLPTLTIVASGVPAPAGVMMLALGLFGLATFSRRSAA